MKKLDQNPSTARQEIIVLGKLTPEEMKIIWQCKSKANKIWFSYQLAFVKIRNYFPKQTPFEIEALILEYIVSQINLSPNLIQQYQHKVRVTREHQLMMRLH